MTSCAPRIAELARSLVELLLTIVGVILAVIGFLAPPFGVPIGIAFLVAAWLDKRRRSRLWKIGVLLLIWGLGITFFFTMHGSTSGFGGNVLP